jgi:hypothetical protein
MPRAVPAMVLQRTHRREVALAYLTEVVVQACLPVLNTFSSRIKKQAAFLAQKMIKTIIIMLLQCMAVYEVPITLQTVEVH